MSDGFVTPPPSSSTVVETGATCCVCSISTYHYGFDPMKMGCQCSERVCKWCVSIGKITQCPICRKHKRKPVVDEKWRKEHLKQDTEHEMNERCLGCNETLPVAQTRNHERTCTAYRDYIEKTYMESVELYRDQANQYETEIKEMNERMNLQEQEIDDLEDSCDGYKMMAAVYEAEKRVYAFEQQNMIGALSRLSRPLQTLGKRVQDMQKTIDDLKNQLRDSRQNHRIFAQKRRRLGLETIGVEFMDTNLEETDEDLQSEVVALIEDAAHPVVDPEAVQNQDDIQNS